MATHSKVVCLLGMHRSGTSLVAGWLQLCGLNIGDNLLVRDFSNKRGHFEDMDFLLLHKEILLFNGIDSSGLVLPDKEIILNKYQHAKMSHFIQMKNELHGQWGWKDPRTCLVIQHYQEKIPNLKILVVHRHPVEIIQSLLTRDWRRQKKEIINRALAGWHPKLLLSHFYKRRLRQYRLLHYNRVCEIYFERLLMVLRSSRPSNKLAFTLPYLLKHDLEIFENLKVGWEMDLNYASISTSYKPQLLGDTEIEITISKKLKDLNDQLLELITYK